MPLFEYQCKKCGRVFEVLQKFAAKPLAVHDHCGGEVEKLLSAPSFQFKGTGFHITDYPKSSQSKPPTPKPETKEAKSEPSKPAADAKPSPAKA